MKMAAPAEVLVTTESSGQLWNACVWDIHSGTTMLTFKGGSSSEKTLVALRGEYLMSAQLGKPLVHVWSIGKRDQVQQRIVCPGHVGAMAATPDGMYIIAAVDEKVHVWQVCTGFLLAVLTHHYQRVTCIRVTSDSSHFVTAAEDGLVLVWHLARVVSSSGGNQQAKPKHSWSQHALPVTDVYVGHGGPKSRVATVSVDQTCKLWDMLSGALLSSFIFEVSLSAVSMDSGEMNIFVGSSTGRIYAISLLEQPSAEHHISDSTARNAEGKSNSRQAFLGHSKHVTCLATTLDGSTLVSGSRDATVKIWDVASRQCVRTITHKGAITNLLVMRAPRVLVDVDARPLLIVKPFERHLHVYGQGKDIAYVHLLPAEDEGSDEDDDMARLLADTHTLGCGALMQAENTVSEASTSAASFAERHRAAEEMDGLRQQVADLQRKVEQLQSANTSLYKLAVSDVLGKAAG